MSRTLQTRIRRLEECQPDDGLAIALRYQNGFIHWGDVMYQNQDEFDLATQKMGREPELFLSVYTNHEF
jgi:hypothetical protein